MLLSRLRVPGAISTHTLTWSTTVLQERSDILFKFQLTHSRGVRPLQITRTAIGIDFNSHTHVEYDETGLPIHPKHANFNSHTHVEYDPRMSPFCG